MIFTIPSQQHMRLARSNAKIEIQPTENGFMFSLRGETGEYHKYIFGDFKEMLIAFGNFLDYSVVFAEAGEGQTK